MKLRVLLDNVDRCKDIFDPAKNYSKEEKINKARKLYLHDKYCVLLCDKQNNVVTDHDDDFESVDTIVIIENDKGYLAELVLCREKKYFVESLKLIERVYNNSKEELNAKEELKQDIMRFSDNTILSSCFVVDNENYAINKACSRPLFEVTTSYFKFLI